ncbi:glucose 1-dehydrogenase [Bradyrhizobium sp. Ash2021]|uniref:SDR family NAD(P)-dependent oxidoreductase n=1 Tax=Bradyrhizobium sp. Ash2021 TaxID=2954771 RepID=UPI002816992C|nr:glucose 1-dehydrogenase [Bradyrhizobium sp. Ash2021]WMT73519.1 glucose 1-dehydrogenase [Bradyrhizobium sp. Ash2021]
MNTLNGKVAIVTGASKGIGAGIARSFGAAGAAVAVGYNGSKEGADRVVAVIINAGGRAIAVQADVGKPDDVKRLFAETTAAFGAPDVVVNNAGVFAFEPVEAISEAEFHRQFNTNVLGPLLTTQEALKAFGPGGGSIINISSVVSKNPTPHSVVYASTKAAVDNMTVALSRELGARNIRVNAIAPGGVETEGSAAAGIVGGEMEKAVVRMTPLGRMGQPADIAKVAVFLASDQASWLTGERISASGGWR